MNDYFFKPKLKELPKLPLTNATTYTTTFYSTRSKTKPTSVQNSHRFINASDNKIIYDSKKDNSNLFLQTENNFFQEKLRKNREKKIKSLFIPKNEMAEEETDDAIFALSEIRIMDKRIAKRVNKNLIWKEKTNNIYDIVTSKNRNDIKEIKKKVRQNVSGISSKLRKEIYKNKYFPEKKIDIINEAQDIMCKVKKSILQENKINKIINNYNRMDLHTFTKQNRDICLKNIFINLIKHESNKIKTKETEINKALEEAKNDYFKDKQVFEEFKNNKKKYYREQEIKLEEAIKRNKTIVEQLKKCSSEIHGTKDEIDKNLRDILLFKIYAEFVHQIIPKDENMKKVKIEKKELLNRERNLEIMTKEIIEEFSFLLGDYQFSFYEDLNNPQILTGIFKNMELNIINSMEERDLTIKEIIKNRKKYEKELQNLKYKMEADQRELESLNQELQLKNNIISPKRDYQKIFEENEKYINIIYNELNKIVKQKKNIQNINLCNETLNLLHKIEDKILTLFNEMDKIKEIEKDNNSDGVFKSIIDNVKNDNKIEKYLESREIALKRQEEKNLKYLQRMNRYKKKGPITFPPPWAIKKSKNKKYEKRDKNKDDEDIIYY